MDNIKKHKIFEDDGTVVEQVEVEKKSPVIHNPLMEKKAAERKTVMVEDVLDSFAGYLPNRIGFLTPGDGKCVFCGATTISPMRKICYDCMVKSGEKLYKEAKKSIEKGDNSFNF